MGEETQQKPAWEIPVTDDEYAAAPLTEENER